jgi:hypothetical protein
MAEQKSLLTQWKEHPTRRSEFLSLLREPVMQDALAIVKEQIFAPKPLVPGTPDIIAWAALIAQKREGYLEMFANFLSLANISPFKTPDRKAWETADKPGALAAARAQLDVDMPVQPVPAAPEQPPTQAL